MYGDRLVAADVERADGQRPAAERVGNRLIGRLLLLLRRRVGTIEEKEFRAQQAAPFRARRKRRLDIGESTEVGEQAEPVRRRA